MGLGVPADPLNGRHQACPGCGGKDRFRFVPADPDGKWFCGQGGSATGGDGFNLLCHVFGWTKSEALHAVADRLGIKPDPKTYHRFKQVIQQRKAREYEAALAHECRVLLMVLEQRIAARQLAGRAGFLKSRIGYMPPPESHWQREEQAARRIHSLIDKLYQLRMPERAA